MQDVCGRADERDTRGRTRLSQQGVLGQEPVARVDGIRTDLERNLVTSAGSR